jgi:hypothetical protein
MDDISSHEQRRALQVATALFDLRQYSTKTEEDRAQELGFGSAQAMYRQLKNWDLPAWLINEPKAAPKSQVEKNRRNSEGGKAKRLPPARRAEQLFRDALESLSGYLEVPKDRSDNPGNFMDVSFTNESRLESLEEWLQDGRFISDEVSRTDPEEVHEIRREDFSEKEWQELCKEHGIDSAQESFHVGAEMGIFSYEAARFPADPIVVLIGAYVLADKPLAPLLDALHPEPEQVDRQQLDILINGSGEGKKHVPGMWYRAQQVAQLVRGGRVRSGRPPEKLSDKDVMTARRIAELKKSRLGYEEIHQRLAALGYGRREIEWLGNTRLPEPSWERGEDDKPE